MADPQDLINALIGPQSSYEEPNRYGRSGFPNLDPRAYMGADRGEPQSLLSQAPWALMGMGRTPARPPAKMEPQLVRREAKQAGDDNVGQHVYETLLARPRKPGQAVGEPGSGWWMVGNQPIPKPTNVLPWVATGGWAYLMNKLWGDPVGDVWQKYQTGKFPSETPDHPKYDPVKEAESLRATARLDANTADRGLAEQLGITQPKWYVPSDFPLMRNDREALDKIRLPGGVGSAPY